MAAGATSAGATPPSTSVSRRPATSAPCSTARGAGGRADGGVSAAEPVASDQRLGEGSAVEVGRTSRVSRVGIAAESSSAMERRAAARLNELQGEEGGAEPGRREGEYVALAPPTRYDDEVHTLQVCSSRDDDTDTISLLALDALSSGTAVPEASLGDGAIFPAATEAVFAAAAGAGGEIARAGGRMGGGGGGGGSEKDPITANPKPLRAREGGRVGSCGDTGFPEPCARTRQKEP